MTITDREKLKQLTQLDIQMNETSDAEEYTELTRQCKRLCLNLDVEIETFECNGKYGLRTKLDNINASTFEVAPAIYDAITIGDICALGRIGSQWVCIYDVDRLHILTVESDEAKLTDCIDLLQLRVRNKWGIYHIQKQQWIAPPEYDEIVEKCSVFLLRHGNKWGVASDRVHVPAYYDRIRFCRYTGFVRFYLGNQSGFVDCNGQWTQDASKAAIWTADYHNMLENLV